jgi:hypothetical protein
MRIEITNNGGVIEGTITWEAGNPVHGAQVIELVYGREDSVHLALVHFGTRTIIVTMRGRVSGNVMEGRYTRLVNDVGLSERGSWRAEKEPRMPTVLGSWRWIKSIGGFAGWELRPPPSIRITYSKDGIFSYYRNDTLDATTTYTIVRKPTIMNPVSGDIIHYGDSLRFVPQAFLIVNDTLYLFDQCIDCYSHWYVRIR